MRRFIKNLLKKMPRLLNLTRGLWRVGMEFVDPSRSPDFEGWYGMSLKTLPPWMETSKVSSENLGLDFLSADKKLRNLLLEGKFRILQFDQYTNLDLHGLLDELMYRHYIVYWSSIVAANNTLSELKNYVEVGVADGLCMYFVNNALTNKYNIKYKTYLYDTWGEVALFNPTMGGTSNYYGFLDLNVTKNNLVEYESSTVFKQGLVPNTFDGINESDSIVWLGIDLNSIPPTIDTLNYFWDKLEGGGVILFDDYAQPSYVDTKNAIDDWVFKHIDATLLQLPTSQAIIFKSH
jgi:hypothetical protein